jgi:signal transduction histidine kinase
VVTVRDHGRGLDEEARAPVLDRFWQADHARVGAGSGLGLAIVDAIAQEHGGCVVVDNADGGGARFMLQLPVPAEGGGTDAAPPALHH